MWEAIAIFFTIVSGIVAVLGFFGIRSIEDIFSRPSRNSPLPANLGGAGGGAASSTIESAQQRVRNAPASLPSHYPPPRRQPAARPPIERAGQKAIAYVESGHLFLGFVAASLSVLIVHQTLVYLLGMYGLSRAVPWSFGPLGYGPFAALPVIANTVFWGGLWGIVFALIYNWLPGVRSWLKGLIFGLLIVIISNWTLLPLIRQYVFNYPPQPLFSGFNPQVMLAVVLIVGGFGLGLGIIYGLIARNQEA